MTLFAPEHITNAAVQASVRMTQGHGTAQDVAAYRTWITWMRLHGDTEDRLQDAVDRVNNYALKMGLT